MQGAKEIDKVRDHFTQTRNGAALPTGDLLRLEVGERLLSLGQNLRGLSSLEAVVEPGAAAVRAQATFRDATQAPQVKATVDGFVTLALAGIAMKSKECEALGKLAIDVKTEGNTMRVTVGGLDAIAEGWDPTLCPKLQDVDG